MRVCARVGRLPGLFIVNLPFALKRLRIPGGHPKFRLFQVNGIDAGIYRQTFTFADGELVRDQNFQFIPCKITGSLERNDYQPYVAEGEEARQILHKMNSYSAAYGLQLDEDGRPVTGG